MNNITESWKTTLLGVLLIISGIAYLFIKPEADVKIVGILLGGGVGMILAPDTILEFITKKSKE